MSTDDDTPPSVFISYSHDSEAHLQRVLDLADRLRVGGLDVRLDQYIESPPEGWPRWTERQAVEADFVLVVCTPTFRERFDLEDTGDAGKGVKWEAMITRQILYAAKGRNERFVPVLFEEGTERDVPLPLQGASRYPLPAEYEKLYRRLTRQHDRLPPPIGKIQRMPPAARPGLGAGAATSRESTPASTKTPEALTDEELIDELAKVLFDDGNARVVVKRAGFPPGQIPVFRTPLVFWTTVVEDARSGVIEGGVQALADAAAALRPGNALFKRYRSQ